VNDPDQMTWGIGKGDDLPEGLWAYDGLSGADDSPAVNVASGFTSLGFIKAALRRRAWLCCLLGIVGLLIGSALYKEFPPAYQASTSVLIVDNPNQDPMTAIQTDISLAQSRTVAGRVVQQLGLNQTVSSLLAAYTVTAVTNQVLNITVGAPSSDAAVSRASAIARQFMKFHGEYAQTQQQQLSTELAQQVSQARQSLNSINQQISQVSAGPSSSSQQAKLKNLQTQRDDAANSLAQIQQYATSTLASAKTITSSIVSNSQILNPAAAVPHSRLKGAALYVAGGLVGGMAVGVGIVIVMALMSDRLRRRDDIAAAIGAPVRLSVGPVNRRRGLPSLPGRSHALDLNMKRVVTHMGKCVPGSSNGPAGLAVVATDNEQVVAPAVISLAVSRAREGKQVVVADLSSSTSLGQLLGVKEPGVREVTQDGVHLTLFIPNRDDAMPIGPLESGMEAARRPDTSQLATEAYASADLLLTLATLDPAFGGEYLATWATDSVAAVTAGNSTAVRIHAIGEMIRLAGIRLDSVIVIDADKDDESLGTLNMPDEFTSVGPL
jgi:capsular polysaccharide biosynthesis protein